MSKQTLSGVKLALTIDDLFMWPGVPFGEGQSAKQVSKQLMGAFANSGVKSVYAFSCTKPAGDALESVLDAWCSAGHHVGNHTHNHCSINWTSSEEYIRDMDRSHEVLRRWIDAAPTKYFRFAFDMWGDSRAKTDDVLVELAKTGFSYAPISLWFYDAQFMMPHARAHMQGNRAKARALEDQFVESWMAQLHHQVQGARAAMGRDVVHIALMHGTPIGGATMDRICARMLEAGVTFVSLEEAMRDPFNAIPPPMTTRFFRSFTQKWCELTKTPLVDTPPAALVELMSVLPMEGLDEATLFKTVFDELASGVNGRAVAEDFWG